MCQCDLFKKVDYSSKIKGDLVVEFCDERSDEFPTTENDLVLAH